nr:immunoglobulin heavy chain junction region [Mus musculus]
CPIITVVATDYYAMDYW